MMSNPLRIFLSLTICGAFLVNGNLETFPENIVARVGETVVLTCSAVADPPARIMWTEYVTNELGAVISDGLAVLPSHPNAARYSILGTGNEFNLEIRDVQRVDGGRYLCQDIQGSPPGTFRRTAELIVLESDPKCSDIPTVTGAIVEDRYYTLECEVIYQGFFSPNISWVGPGTYRVDQTVTTDTVWSMVSFTAEREIAGGEFFGTTSFVLPDNLPENGATNTPDYTYVHRSGQFVVHWAPKDHAATPIKDFYVAGDVLTCTADSNPAARFTWANMRTLVVEPPGENFTITAELEGFDQVMRCNANVMIEGGMYTSDIFVNVSVPAITTPTTTPTTPPSTIPPDDAPCDDVTGHWSSTNPNAHVCLEMDSKGNLLTLIRNGTDPFFVAGNGKTVFNDYKHIGFTGVWPAGNNNGVAGFTGECHKCKGNEVILLSGLSRDKSKSLTCGDSVGTELTKLYILTRYGPPCRQLNMKVYRPTKQHIERMGIRPEDIMT